MELTPSVVYRGSAFDRITAEDYDEAIQDLQEAKTQLEPDGDNCHVCHDSGHQAWECHHNPLAMARQAAHMRHQWRCFHCGEVFTDATLAAEHFGNRGDEKPAACLIAEAREADRLRALLREAMAALQEYGRFSPLSVNGGSWISFPPQQLAHSAELAAKIRAELEPDAKGGSDGK